MMTDSDFKVDLNELRDKISRAEGLILIDLLSARRYFQGHLPGAINVAFQGLEAWAQEILSKQPECADKEVVIYCSSADCDASERAGSFLRELGFKYARYYPGGIDEWTRAGEKLETGGE